MILIKFTEKTLSRNLASFTADEGWLLLFPSRVRFISLLNTETNELGLFWGAFGNGC